jgi:magnesium-transporting ATPase (P-type)
MEFKRCSVDGHIFGMPIAKAAPALQADRTDSVLSDSVHPLKNLLAGSEHMGNSAAKNAEEITATNENSSLNEMGKKLTFNAEMFLRVMSICHTVVVEKDHKAPELEVEASNSVKKNNFFFKSKKSNTGSSVGNGVNISESNQDSSTSAQQSMNKGGPVKAKKKDGAPEGSNYQAESPDEGALVSAASNEYGFQLIGRDSSGVQISCPCPSLLQDADIIEGVKNGTISAKSLAAQTLIDDPSKYSQPDVKTVNESSSPRIETWSILAINKFDSDRKRMSVLVRSPPELGSIPLLLCKGADSSMLLEGVCDGLEMVEQIDNSNLSDDSEVKALLGLQSHLGGELHPLSNSFVTSHALLNTARPSYRVCV